MLAALIGAILDQVEVRPRILIACETNRALDQIFLKVLELFKTNKAKYNHVYQRLLRVGKSDAHVVRKRELKGTTASCRTMLASAQAVFTTFGSSYQADLQVNQEPFSFIIFEEACLVNEAAGIHALMTGCVSHIPSPDNSFRKVVWACVGDHRKLHELVVPRRTVPYKLQSHFFDRVWVPWRGNQGINAIQLIKQYRMNPELAKFISSQFYDDRLETPADKNVQWKDDSTFNTLRRHVRFPVRNVMTIDTSPESQVAHETMGSGRSFYNVFEVKVIKALLTAWYKQLDITEFPQHVTIVTTYARQRSEIQDALNAAGMHWFRVCTVDELQGGENDIIILSLVRARSASEETSSSPASTIGFVSNAERINVALSRAKRGVVVIGYVSHIAGCSPVWHNFFGDCLQKSSGEEVGKNGYFRLPYVDMDTDLRLAPFSPPYLK